MCCTQGSVQPPVWPGTLNSVPDMLFHVSPSCVRSSAGQRPEPLMQSAEASAQPSSTPAKVRSRICTPCSVEVSIGLVDVCCGWVVDKVTGTLTEADTCALCDAGT